MTAVPLLAAMLLAVFGSACPIRAAGPHAARRVVLGCTVMLAFTVAAPGIATAAAAPPSGAGSSANSALIDQLTQQVNRLSQRMRGVTGITVANERVKTLLALRQDLVDHAADLIDQAAQAPKPAQANALSDQVLRVLSEVRNLDQRVRDSMNRPLAGQWLLAERWLKKIGRAHV